jgi:hypothetical protein
MAAWMGGILMGTRDNGTSSSSSSVHLSELNNWKEDRNMYQKSGHTYLYFIMQFAAHQNLQKSLYEVANINSFSWFL